MQLVFLGTSAMVPTKERNHSAIFIRHGSVGFLFDCGEGTQRQLRIAGIKPSSVDKIILSHWDGDHVLGLPGLIQTLAMAEENKLLVIYGPKGTENRFKHMLKAFEFYNKITLDVREFAPGKFYDADGLELHAHALEHKVPSYGFEIIEKDRRRIALDKAKALGIPEGPLMGKLQRGESIVHKGKKIAPEQVTYSVAGKKIGIISDTRLCRACYGIAGGKDIVISDSTFAGREEEKAHEYFHMTNLQAALVAQQAGAKRLILTHFSQRYKDVKAIEDEARDIFPETVAAYDFMKIKV